MVAQRMTFKEMLNVSGVTMVILWAAVLIAYFLPINQFGIWPREWWGLTGIPLAPFLHANVGHLLANMSALLFLGLALMLLEGRKAVLVLLTIVLLGGLGTWLIGRGGVPHVGASGVIFGLMGYLIASGWYRAKFAYVVVALLVLFFYGGALWGVLPQSPCVSWEGHLCGLLAGVGDAKWRAGPAKAA
ncbi:MAG TPA: rhomboid family intramembrane serine protease [Planctomycetota bacterium]|nr:rhomboid family intramembrane serine protease [Planctomycetota bacterium]